MKEKFLREFEIVGMSRNSIIVTSRDTFDRVYVSRKVFNAIMSGIVNDYRVVEVNMDNGPILWLEATIWTRY